MDTDSGPPVRDASGEGCSEPAEELDAEIACSRGTFALPSKGMRNVKRLVEELGFDAIAGGV